jgi:hypothetical protein
MFADTPDRRCFLAHFLICLGIGGGAFFAWFNGVPQAIFAADQSMMTSVIASFFVVSTLNIGRISWDAGPNSNAAFGHLAVRLSVMAGIIGTAVGLSLQAKSLIGGSAAFLPLATSLYTTVAGATSAILLEILTFNLEVGIKRSAR